METDRRSPVLVVEDNPLDLKLARILLELDGYQVRTAGSAEEALVVLGGLVPALLLVDIDLPGMSGLELTGRMRTHPGFAGLPILAMSATAGAGAPARAAAAGCNGFVPKPFDPRTFQATVSRWASSRGADHPAD